MIKDRKAFCVDLREKGCDPKAAMFTLFQIAAGGAIGAVLRFAVVQRIGLLVPGGFPFGTLVVNAVGSFLMGLVVAWAASRAGGLSAGPMAFLTVGLLGGFTTFSAFSLDVMRLIERGAMASAFTYIAASVGVSIALLALGLLLGRGVAS